MWQGSLEQSQTKLVKPKQIVRTAKQKQHWVSHPVARINY